MEERPSDFHERSRSSSTCDGLEVFESGKNRGRKGRKVELGEKVTGEA